MSTLDLFVVSTLCFFVLLNIAAVPLQLYYYRQDYLPTGSWFEETTKRDDNWFIRNGDTIRTFLGWCVHAPLPFMILVTPVVLFGLPGFYGVVFFLGLYLPWRYDINLDYMFSGEESESVTRYNRMWQILLETPRERRYRLACETFPLPPVRRR